ncbi:MAG: hypothetical protein WCK15_20195 [Pirellula sp.]
MKSRSDTSESNTLVAKVSIPLQWVCRKNRKITKESRIVFLLTQHLVVSITRNYNRHMTLPAFTSQPDTKTRPPEAVPRFRFAYWVAAVLLVSGCVHLAMFAILGTIWSIACWMTPLRSQKLDPLLIKSLAIGWLFKVALITFQIQGYF